MRVRALADVTGTIGSVVCAAHCLLGPLTLLIAPALPALLLVDGAFHQVMLYIVVPAGLVGFALGCWRHKDRWTMAIGGVGLLGLSLAATAGHDYLGVTSERGVTLLAAFVLMLAHARNYRLCRTEQCQHQGDTR